MSAAMPSTTPRKKASEVSRDSKAARFHTIISLRPEGASSKARVVIEAGGTRRSRASEPSDGSRLGAMPATTTFWIREPESFGQIKPDPTKP
jgi:hypothetical protein